MVEHGTVDCYDLNGCRRPTCVDAHRRRAATARRAELVAIAATMIPAPEPPESDEAHNPEE